MLLYSAIQAMVVSTRSGGYLVTPDYSPGDPGVSLADVLAIASNSKSGGCERSLWRR